MSLNLRLSYPLFHLFNVSRIRCNHESIRPAFTFTQVTFLNDPFFLIERLFRSDKIRNEMLDRGYWRTKGLEFFRYVGYLFSIECFDIGILLAESDIDIRSWMKFGNFFFFFGIGDASFSSAVLNFSEKSYKSYLITRYTLIWYVSIGLIIM